MKKIDLTELKRGAGYLFVGQISQAAIGFGSNLVLVRYLFPEDFGHFALIMAGVALIFAIMSFRIDAMIIRTPHAELSQHARNRYFSAAIYETIIASVLLVIMLKMNGQGGGWEYGLVLALAVRHWAQQNKGFYERTLPYRKLAIVETSVATSGSILAVCLVWFGFGAEVLFLREFYLSVCGVLGMWWIGGITICRLKVLSLDDMRTLFHDAKGLWIDGVLENSFGRIVILLVGEIGGERLAGFFFQAQKLALIPQQLIAPVIGRVAGNWFARVDDGDWRQKGRNRLLVSLAVVLAIPALICIASADVIVPMLLGDRWSQSANLLVGMSGFMMFIPLFEMLRNYCWATKRVRWLLVGRVAQYIGGAAPVAFYFLGWFPVDVTLALALSSAYMLAFVTLLVILVKTENPPRKA